MKGLKILNLRTIQVTIKQLYEEINNIYTSKPFIFF